MTTEKKKTILVLGLGIFGMTAAEDLTKYGQNVIAVDKDLKKVEKIADDVTQAVCCDFTDIEQLTSVGVEDVDVAIIATGDDLQAAILAVLNLKELGVPVIVAKANDTVGRKVLKKIGADQVITPEADIAKQTSKKLAFEHVTSLFDIDKAFSVIEIHVFQKWVGHTLAELNLRHLYNINVIAIRQNGKLSVNVDPNVPLGANDQLLVIGGGELYAKLKDNA